MNIMVWIKKAMGDYSLFEHHGNVGAIDGQCLHTATISTDEETVDCPVEYEYLLVNDPKLEIYCEPQRLIDALHGFKKDSIVKLTFNTSKDPFEISGIADKDIDAFALVMPKKQDFGIRYWKPKP